MPLEPECKKMLDSDSTLLEMVETLEAFYVLDEPLNFTDKVKAKAGMGKIVDALNLRLKEEDDFEDLDE